MSDGLAEFLREKEERERHLEQLQNSASQSVELEQSSIIESESEISLDSSAHDVLIELQQQVSNKNEAKVEDFAMQARISKEEFLQTYIQPYKDAKIVLNSGEERSISLLCFLLSLTPLQA